MLLLKSDADRMLARQVDVLDGMPIRGATLAARLQLHLPAARRLHVVRLEP